MNGLGILGSVQLLLSDPRTRPFVEKYAKDSLAFSADFARDMEKINVYKVKVDNQGEVRRRCDAPNTKRYTLCTKITRVIELSNQVMANEDQSKKAEEDQSKKETNNPKSYQVRKECIKRKSMELATLCDIKVCTVITSPNGELQTWPDNLNARVLDLYSQNLKPAKKH
ncbi:hypothetical protein RDI58_015599 [Solanum bulbocastanum]|uniref:peroxidase n=1 Tax=Solanum bulbocastanum TaxID=147425 RepID=A0AAN8YBQ9_SOLBU